MKRFSEQFYTEAKSVKLKAQEKRELRERLTAYMEYHPLPAELKANQPAKKLERITAEPFRVVSVPFSFIFKSSAVAAALVLVVVPFMAEQAVPGDTLYAIKVQFNEELRSTLTFDAYEKVEWETERLNRRIAEARLLASQGRLTEAVEAEVAQAVRTHTENAQREIEALRIEDADGATIAEIAFDSTLEVQSSSLMSERENRAQTSSEEANRPDLIAEVINESLNAANEDDASTTPPAYEKLMARAEQNTTRIYELRESVNTHASEEQQAVMNRRIEDIERAIAEVIAVVDVEEFDSEVDQEARTKLVDVLQRSQRLIVYMTQIELMATIDISTLVPIVLTEAEKQQVSEEMITEIDTKMTQAEELAALVEDSAISEKVAVNLADVSLLQAELASTTDFERFQEGAKEALLLLNDTIALLEAELAPTDSEAIETETEDAVDPVVSEEEASTTPEVVEEEMPTTTVPQATSSEAVRPTTTVDIES